MEKDIVCNAFFSDNERYADIINGIGCKGISFGMNFAIVGIESQEKIDYALVLRAMGYDVGEYERQAFAIRKEVRKGCNAAYNKGKTQERREIK